MNVRLQTLKFQNFKSFLVKLSYTLPGNWIFPALCYVIAQKSLRFNEKLKAYKSTKELVRLFQV